MRNFRREKYKRSGMISDDVIFMLHPSAFHNTAPNGWYEKRSRWEETGLKARARAGKLV
jgi:hypothetical protein